MTQEIIHYDLRQKKAIKRGRRKRTLYWGFVLLILLIEVLLLLFISSGSDLAFYLHLLNVVFLCIAVLLGYRDLFGGEHRSSHSLEFSAEKINYQRAGMKWSLPISEISSFREKDTRIDIIDRSDEAHSLDLGDMRMEDFIPLKERLNQIVEKNRLKG